MKSKEYIDNIITAITKMETRMQDLQFTFPVQMGELTWELYGKKAPRMRITYQGEPLVSAPFIIVEKLYKQIIELYELADKAAHVGDDKVEEMRENLRKMNHVLLAERD